MQQTMFFYGESIAALSTAINAWFTANPGFVGVSISVIVREVGFEALVMYTP